MGNGADARNTEEIFQEVKARLPADWHALRDPLRLHHLMKAVNDVLRPDRNWILVNGDLTLLDLLSDETHAHIEKSQ